MKLSVIVPSYNVSNYLEECIESIVAQEMDSMEIIIVNDGSTDNTLEIARMLEREYEQVVVIDQPNGGLGNARNTGAAYATGEFIAFVDSDDVLTKGSYQLMINTLEKSGSDFVIGNVVRFNSTKTFGSTLHKKVFHEDLIGVSVREHHELLYDTTAWNKVFRMDFWRDNHFSFPEKMLYEDIPVTIPAHAIAKKVDVLKRVVYKWRARDSGDFSITQQREQINNFLDRVKGIDMVRDFFDKHAIPSELQQAYDLKNLQMDFPLYLNYMLVADKEYQQALSDYVIRYLDTVDYEVFMQLSILLKIKYRLIQQNRFSDFLQVIRNDRRKKNNIRVETMPNGFYTFNYQFSDVLTDEEKIADVEFSPVRWIERATWVNNDLHIDGVAYLSRLPYAHKKDSKMVVNLVSAITGNKIPLPASQFKRKLRLDVTVKRGGDVGSKIPFKRLHNYNYTGFQLCITNKTFLKLNPSEEYFVEITITHGKVEKSFNLGGPKPGYASKPKSKLYQQDLFKPQYTTAWEMIVSRESLKDSILSTTFDDMGILINGTVSDEDTKQLSMWSTAFESEKYELETKITGNHYTARIPNSLIEQILAPDDEGKVVNKRFRFSFTDEQWLNRNDDFSAHLDGFGNDRQITVIPTNDGTYMLQFGQVIAITTDLKEHRNNVTLTFMVPTSFFADALDYSVILNGGIEVYDLPFEIVSQNKHVTLIKAKIEWLMPEKRRNFWIRLKKTITRVSTVKEIQNDEVLVGQKIWKKDIMVPIYLYNMGIDKIIKKKQGIKYEVYHPLGKHHLQYRVSSYWERIDDGPKRQEIVRRVLYPMWRKMPVLKNVCVLESFWGREFSDNPKAIYDYMVNERPNMKYIIPMQNTLEHIEYRSENTEIVKRNSWRYMYYLARGKYFFNNVNFPDYYRKRTEAIEVQTMHGTPLKRLGLDNPGEIPDHLIKQFIEKCKRWDYLTIPSDYVGEIAKSAYRFEGTLLKTGYPRNDSLFEINDSVRKDIFEKYGLPSDKKVILYAPTWRVQGKFSMPMDLKKMQEILGDEYIVIIKLHHYMIPNFSLDEVKGFAYRFGRGSIISDFYKIADMLITDYSSVMFDYAILQRPMLFFTYDYDNYKDNLRGMYFDFKEDAPGPLVENTDDLIEEILHIDDYSEKYKEQIEHFTKKFIQYDTGNASKELIERVIDK